MFDLKEEYLRINIHILIRRPKVIDDIYENSI